MDEEGNRYRIDGITLEQGKALHHSPSWVALFPCVYAIPAPTAETD